MKLKLIKALNGFPVGTEFETSLSMLDPLLAGHCEIVDLNDTLVATGVELEIKNDLNNPLPVANATDTDGTQKTQIVGPTGNVAIVSPANTARSATDKVILVQTINPDGSPGTTTNGLTDAQMRATPVPMSLADGADVTLGAKSDSAANNSTSSWSVVALLKGLYAWCVSILNSAGELKVFNPPSTMLAEYRSPTDFAVTYLGATTLTVAGAPFAVDDAVCRVTSIMYKKVDGLFYGLWNSRGGVSIACSSGTITVTGAGATPFLATDILYDVNIVAQKKAYDATTDTTKVTVQNPGNINYVVDSVVSVVNQAASTVNYPSDSGMSMDGYSDLTVNAYLIDANSVTSVVIQATNDPALTNTSWVDVTKLFSDDNAGINSSIGTGFTVSSSAGKGFALSKSNFNYTYFRFAVTTADATNSIYIWTRRKY